MRAQLRCRRLRCRQSDPLLVGSAALVELAHESLTAFRPLLKKHLRLLHEEPGSRHLTLVQSATIEGLQRVRMREQRALTELSVARAAWAQVVARCC